MAKVDPPPPTKELELRRKKPPTIVDPTHITAKDTARASQWALEKVNKHLDKCNDPAAPENQVLASGDLEPEALDIRAAYPFPNLHWIIFKRRSMIHLTLLSDHKPLFTSSYIDI